MGAPFCYFLCTVVNGIYVCVSIGRNNQLQRTIDRYTNSGSVMSQEFYIKLSSNQLIPVIVRLTYILVGAMLTPALHVYCTYSLPHVHKPLNLNLGTLIVIHSEGRWRCHFGDDRIKRRKLCFFVNMLYTEK